MHIWIEYHWLFKEFKVYNKENLFLDSMLAFYCSRPSIEYWQDDLIKKALFYLVNLKGQSSQFT